MVHKEEDVGGSRPLGTKHQGSNVAGQRLVVGSVTPARQPSRDLARSKPRAAELASLEALSPGLCPHAASRCPSLGGIFQLVGLLLSSP